MERGGFISIYDEGNIASRGALKYKKAAFASETSSKGLILDPMLMVKRAAHELIMRDLGYFLLLWH